MAEVCHLLLTHAVNVAVVDTKPATKQWQKFVAATDTAASQQSLPAPPPPPPPTAVDDDTATTTTSSVAAKSVSAASVGDEPKDDIDMKLQDFLAVSCRLVFAKRRIC